MFKIINNCCNNCLYSGVSSCKVRDSFVEKGEECLKYRNKMEGFNLSNRSKENNSQRLKGTWEF